MANKYYKLSVKEVGYFDVLASSLSNARASLRILIGGALPIGNQVTEGLFPIDFSQARVYAKFKTTGVIEFVSANNEGQYLYTMLSIEADSANIPLFTGISKWGGSLDYNVANGAVNHIMFFSDDYKPYYTIVPAL